MGWREEWKGERNGLHPLHEECGCWMDRAVVCGCASMVLLSWVGETVYTHLVGWCVLYVCINSEASHGKRREVMRKDVILVHTGGRYCRDSVCLVLDSTAHSLFLCALHVVELACVCLYCVYMVS